MSGAFSSRPIAGGSVNGSEDDPNRPNDGPSRRIRARVLRNRYPGIDADAPVDPIEEVKPTPIYDALSDAEKATVDRLIVGYRMSKQMEIA